LNGDRLIIGVDDAGRGCIIGPLFIGGVSMKEEVSERLRSLGVKDSKLLTPSGRERLYKLILDESSDHVILAIPPEEIDEFVRHRQKHTKLNYLEAMYMARAVDSLEGEVAYIDASDTDAAFFSEQVRQNLHKQISIVATHHADRIFPVVSAASILAKVNRDREIERIKAELGDFGSGYPSDPRTIDFLRSWIESHGQPPPYTRRSWKTWKRVGGSSVVKNLDRNI
jgi:ribonuclease HII